MCFYTYPNGANLLVLGASFGSTLVCGSKTL